ncbi:hydrogen peroxide-inducible genes activator [Pacificimonas sp. WHA3]|uniref:Hydrogen peroxide-inducible genes activator n=1 Tax=Pacificimonas pallii TaxID=2827236 RepID=A0ABS6SHV9_9SPHN|nr:hydrogen peroxide-inducible genes activator [Pacificimonas pallii]MBV7257931.1 hydrogen peroxide-inducible genes activator [Pacificimonas pallii]
MPTLRQLDYLVALADTGHFGRAASQAGVSQPTLSQQVKALEQRLGVTLIERRGRGALLTPAGRDIAERARMVVVAVGDIRDFAVRAEGRLAGTLRFGVTPTLGPYLLPAVVAQLHRDAPDLKLFMQDGIPDEQLQALTRGQLDLLLGPLPLDAPGVVVEPLFREPLRLVVPADHVLAAGADIRELAEQQVLSLDRRHHYHRQAEALCAEYGMRLIRGYEGTSLDSLQQMTASGLGLSILPELYLRSEAGGRSGTEVPDIKGWSAFRSIGLAWREGAALTDAFRAVGERISARARTLLA